MSLIPSRALGATLGAHRTGVQDALTELLGFTEREQWMAEAVCAQVDPDLSGPCPERRLRPVVSDAITWRAPCPQHPEHDATFTAFQSAGGDRLLVDCHGVPAEPPPVEPECVTFAARRVSRGPWAALRHWAGAIW